MNRYALAKKLPTEEHEVLKLAEELGVSTNGNRDVAPLIPLFCVTVGASSQIVTELTGLPLYKSLRLNPWDEKGQKLVSFRSSKRSLQQNGSKG